MRLTKGGIITAVVAAVVVIGLTVLTSPWIALAVILGLVLVVALLLLFAAKTKTGRRGAEAVGRRVGKTRVGQKLGHAQLRAEAKRRGIPTTDPLGRELSDFEIQLELVDTPESRAIKKQLRGLNPQQRAQALRMMEAQAKEMQQTGAPPQNMPPPRTPSMSGRPVTRPPRSRKKRRR